MMKCKNCTYYGYMGASPDRDCSNINRIFVDVETSKTISEKYHKAVANALAEYYDEMAKAGMPCGKSYADYDIEEDGCEY